MLHKVTPCYMPYMSYHELDQIIMARNGATIQLTKNNLTSLCQNPM